MQSTPHPKRSYRNHPAYPRPLDEVMDEAAAEFEEFKRHPVWDKWTFEPTCLVLWNDEYPSYEIDLRTCGSPEDVLDWLAHARGHVSPEQVGYLVLALNDLLPFREHLLAWRSLGGGDIPDVRAHLEREGWLVSTKQPTSEPAGAPSEPAGPVSALGPGLED